MEQWLKEARDPSGGRMHRRKQIDKVGFGIALECVYTTITINRPKAMNALHPDMMPELSARLLLLGIDMPHMSASFLRMLAAEGAGIVCESGEFFEPLAAVYPTGIAEERPNIRRSYKGKRTINQNAKVPTRFRKVLSFIYIP